MESVNNLACFKTSPPRDDGFELIKQYFDETKFVRHQIEQFNYFIEHEMRNIVRHESPITSGCGNIHVKFLNIKIERPYFTKKVVKKNFKTHSEASSSNLSCIEITPDAAIAEGGETGSYETVPLYPNEARKRNLSYDGTILLSVQITSCGKQATYHDIAIGKLPIMLHSSACWIKAPELNDLSRKAVIKEECVNDFGGYFIIKGKERVLVSQLRRAYNRVYVEREENNYIAEMRSTNRFGASILVHLKYLPTTKEFMFSLPYVKTKNLLPGGLVFRALGSSEAEMIYACNCENIPEIKNVLLTQFRTIAKTKEEALTIIATDMTLFKEKELKKGQIKEKSFETFFETDTEVSSVNLNVEEQDFVDDKQISPVDGQSRSGLVDSKKKWVPNQKKTNKLEATSPGLSTKYIEEVLQNELFYHVGKLTAEKSITQLGFMIRKIIHTVEGARVLDDKDNIANKRVDAASSLLSFLFQILFKQFIKIILNQIDGKKSPDVLAIMKDVKTITNSLNQIFMTGNWNTQKSSSFTRVGVSQVLSMQNYGAKMSHLRRLMLPVGGKGKNSKIRQLDASHFSFICPYETPEGETVGIVSNLALSAHITIDTDQETIMSEIISMPMFLPKIENGVLIVLNGYVIGCCKNPTEFQTAFNQKRLQNGYHNISLINLYNEREIHIETDEGRFIRPLFTVDCNNNIEYKKLAKTLGRLPTWKECVDSGAVVFRDAWELELSVVAMTEEHLLQNRRYHYLEISPSSTMMGVMASVIPLSNHSQSPRIAYQASMGKQAIGIPSTAYKNRYDTTLHINNTTQKPIVRSEMVEVLKFDEMCHGCIVNVAIMTFCGFNQEDSIILNKGSLDRGLFSTTTYKTIVEEEKKRGKTDIECICAPEYQYRNKNYNYSYINEQGFVSKPNIWLSKNVVIIGKIVKKTVKNEDGTKHVEISDSSVVIKHGEEGYLDNVLVTMNGEGVRLVKIRLRIPKIPELGDKFASSTAQKGTCGLIAPEENLPFDEQGIKPDLIINPHAIPSRMTINMLIEMFFNKVACKIGKVLDATPFKHRNIQEELQYFSEITGISIQSNIMYDGITGRKIKDKIYMAPCYYQRLKHLVSEKIHARMSGPLDTLTHQPVAGRAKNGALRFGEMEKDAILGHGSTRVLKENLYDKSDAFQVPVCVACGKISDKRTLCNTCGTSSIEMKNMPYAAKLLLQEVAGMGIKTSIH